MKIYVSLERGGSTGALWHATGTNGDTAGARSSRSMINGTTGDTAETTRNINAALGEDFAKERTKTHATDSKGFDLEMKVLKMKTERKFYGERGRKPIRRADDVIPLASRLRVEHLHLPPEKVTEMESEWGL
ncbi:unnamed protein product [Heligmosomoides polygyrus]|uniref:MBF1 domain-containing protein n=1 Tax=Heligmosomoides polygyrus TaxID=6339 RepID=A0A183GCR3_HELPZ|nr:unnamed protein product [Heligmosomoides polygyrus]